MDCAQKIRHKRLANTLLFSLLFTMSSLHVLADEEIKAKEQALLEQEKEILNQIGDIFEKAEARASLSISVPPPATLPSTPPSGSYQRSEGTSFIDSVLDQTHKNQQGTIVHQYDQLEIRHQELKSKEYRFAAALTQTQNEYQSLSVKVESLLAQSQEALTVIHDLGTRVLLLQTAVGDLNSVADGQELDHPTSRPSGWRQGERYARYRFPKYSLQVALPVRGRRSEHSKEEIVTGCSSQNTPCAFGRNAEGTPLKFEPDGLEIEGSVVSKGEPLRIDYRSGDWYRVETSSRKLGWIHSQDIIFGPSQNLRPSRFIRIEGVKHSNDEPGRL